MIDLIALAAWALTPIAEEPEVPFTESDYALIKSRVGQNLKDAESARWSLPERRHWVHYCGWVNAKNGFGAYAGWTPFHALVVKNGDDPVIINFDPSLILRSKVTYDYLVSSCTEAGYNVITPPLSAD